MHHKMISVLSKLFDQNAWLQVQEDNYLERPDVSEKAIYIIGNYEGFICLTHILLYLSNEAQVSYEITSLPFVKNEIGIPLYFESVYSHNDEWGQNGFVKKAPDKITWLLGEESAAASAALIHGLGYSWNHLHFDAKDNSQYSMFMTI
jgi:hypothetical protein